MRSAPRETPPIWEFTIGKERFFWQTILRRKHERLQTEFVCEAI